MEKAAENFWDMLSQNEGNFAQAIMAELNAQAWAAPILAGVRDNGGIVQGNKDRLFELRFAYALHGEGVQPQYEIAGVGGSTIDFGFNSRNQNWRVELVRLGETRAARAATNIRVDADGIPWTGRILRTDADDSRESTEGETLKAVQRICQKCESNGKPHKFSVPDGGYHAILIDFRTFLNGGDVYDRVHVALGAGSVGLQHRLFWEGRPITGVYSPETNLRGAAECRARVHFLGFLDERTYRPGEFAAVTQFVANPNLFANAAEARTAIATWPLQPARLINGRD